MASVPFFANAEPCFVSEVVTKLKYEVFLPGWCPLGSSTTTRLCRSSCTVWPAWRGVSGAGKDSGGRDTPCSPLAPGRWRRRGAGQLLTCSRSRTITRPLSFFLEYSVVITVQKACKKRESNRFLYGYGDNSCNQRYFPKR